MDKISIIVPVYNVEKFIGECIESILNQDHKDFELILVDDGSKDGSLAICQEYGKKDTRIKVFNKENGGVSSARNFGIEKASGKYLTFIDSDDFVSSNYCSLLLSRSKDEIGMVVLGLQKVYENGSVNTISHRIPAGEYSYDEMIDKIIDDGTLSGFTIHSSCAILFKRNIIINNQLRFKQDIKYNEDGLFNAEYFLRAKQNVFIDYQETVYSYRTNLESATKQVDLCGEKFIFSMFRVREELEKYKDIIGEKNIVAQIKRREASIVLDKLIYLAKKNNLTAKGIRSLMANNDAKEGFGLLRKKKLGRGKRLMVGMLKLKAYKMVAIILNRKYKAK